MRFLASRECTSRKDPRSLPCRLPQPLTHFFPKDILWRKRRDMGLTNLTKHLLPQHSTMGWSSPIQRHRPAREVLERRAGRSAPGLLAYGRRGGTCRRGGGLVTREDGCKDASSQEAEIWEGCRREVWAGGVSWGVMDFGQ